jgi:hypothetical protein
LDVICENFVRVGEFRLVRRRRLARIGEGKVAVRGNSIQERGEGGTDKIPSSWFAGLSKLVVRSENEENFWSHFEVSVNC